MNTNYLERYLRDICKRLSIFVRNQDILIDRISKHKTYHELSIKYRISQARLKQPVMKFWRRLWIGSRAFGKFCKEEDELMKELKTIVLYNPAKVRELLNKNHPRLITEYDFSNRIENCLQIAGLKTIEELVQKTENDLLCIRTLGKKCIEEIKSILSRYGYSLREKE